ncbi:MAG: hypothetical protein Kow00120_08870 [Anaerolineae bacterium]
MSDDANERTGCLAALLGLFMPGGKPQETATDEEALPYQEITLQCQLQNHFLNSAELSFYSVLKRAVGDQVAICPKVRLGDIVHTNDLSTLNRINRKHVDYLLCDAASMRPLVGIELDDSSHERSDRKQRDEIVDGAFKAAGLPLRHMRVGRGYKLAELTASLAPYLGGEGDASTPLCPKCGVAMVVRTATRGAHQGKQFYACPNYPQCKEIIPIEDATPAAV